MASEPEAPMPPYQAADYSFHTQYERSNIECNYRGAARIWMTAAEVAANDLVLIATDDRYRV